MSKFLLLLCAPLLFSAAFGSPALLKTHCAECHNDKKAKGKFKLSQLGDAPTPDSLPRWLEALDLVRAGEMPPEKDSAITQTERKTLANWMEAQVRSVKREARRTPERRMNNREFENSIRDVLLIEDVGTHFPTDNLVGDSLHHGFDTHGTTLGFSKFHLEQYLAAARKIVDATILETSEAPPSKRVAIKPEQMIRQQRGQNIQRRLQRGRGGFIDILAPDFGLLLEPYPEVPATGRYRITVRATGLDRTVYDPKDSGFYREDPIQLEVRLGNRVRTFDLPDEEEKRIVLDEWLAAGTKIVLKNPTDAFRIQGNGNFKFQYRIAATHIKRTDPARYQAHIKRLGRRLKGRGDAWQNWTTQWEGARPRVFGVVVEGPMFDQWPSKRQRALLGANPRADQAAELLTPIAERAWRRSVRPGELEPIVALVQAKASELGDVGALKEGIIAILVSPDFLMLNRPALSDEDRFASKFATFLHSTLPSAELREKVAAGKLSDWEQIRREFEQQVDSSAADPFLNAFPYAWLELNDINFMAPDPQRYAFYHKKRVSEDMVAEVRRFFRHMVAENRPIPEFFSADYSFVNADLAQIYGISGVREDSTLRKITFEDGRRGGLLGMGAFLTSTADSLGTSPIHRAVYVMENFMGIHPTPPPPDVQIEEPDVRDARTIKEILAAHTEEATCASCHRSIDPWGYAFENFDPTGAWRDTYGEKRSERIRIDASAAFRNGVRYNDIADFRKQLRTEANRDRFVRCFITKLLTFANGEAPRESDHTAIGDILKRSAAKDYRIVETIAAVIDSPLFRD